jgi:tetratricopeptide (TPR) repeat protein
VVLAHAERAQRLTSQAFGEDDRRSLEALAILGMFESQTQRYEEAYQTLRRVLGKWKGGNLGDNNTTFGYLGTMIQAATFSGHLDEAEDYVAMGHRVSALQSDPRSVWIGCVLYSESLLRIQQARPEEAILAARKAEEIALASDGERSPLYPHALAAEGDALDLEHRYADAKPILAHALEAFEKYMSPDVDDSVEALRSMAVAEIGLGHPENAIPLVERAFVREGKHHAFAGQLAALRFTLARALVASHGDSHRAQELLEQARAELVPLAWQMPLLEEVERWMRANDFPLGAPPATAASRAP